MVRRVVSIAFALMLAGCNATTRPTISPETVASFKLTDIDVQFEPTAVIHFSDAEDEVEFGKVQLAADARDAGGQAATRRCPCA